jgi:hypothetical protein
VGWPCPYRTTIDSSMSTAYDAGNNDNVTLCPMVAHVEWSNNLTVMSKLAFVVLGHRQRYNFQEPLASAKVSTRTLPFAGRAVYLRKERVGGSFRSAYLRVTPVLGHWGVYLLGWWTRHAANGHGTRGMQVGADSGRLAGRAITHHRQPATKYPN